MAVPEVVEVGLLVPEVVVVVAAAEVEVAAPAAVVVKATVTPYGTDGDVRS